MCSLDRKPQTLGPWLSGNTPRAARPSGLWAGLSLKPHPWAESPVCARLLERPPDGAVPCTGLPPPVQVGLARSPPGDAVQSQGCTGGCVQASEKNARLAACACLCLLVGFPALAEAACAGRDAHHYSSPRRAVLLTDTREKLQTSAWVSGPECGPVSRWGPGAASLLLALPSSSPPHRQRALPSSGCAGLGRRTRVGRPHFRLACAAGTRMPVCTHDPGDRGQARAMAAQQRL